MNTLRNRVIKATALGLALAVSHVFLSAEIVRAATSRLVAAAVPAQGATQGRLTTRGNNPVTVGGNSARSGETVFSGQSIQTPAGVGATVNLPGLGRVDIAPDSNVTLSFEAGKINVTVVSGCAVLTANRGTAGTLESGGTTRQTDGERGGTLDTCDSTPGGPAAAGAGSGAGAGAAPAGAGTVGAGGLGTGTSLALMAASVGTFALVSNRVISTPCRRGPNPSPVTPRGRNDECRD
jgi:hypothetical protein